MAQNIIRRLCIPLNVHFDNKTGPIRVIATTESPFIDNRYNPPALAVNLVDGFQLPPSADQVPLLDSHNLSASSVLGYARNFLAIDDRLECDIFFADTPVAKEVVQKLKDGYLNNFSVGYYTLKERFIEEGKSEIIKGRTYQGPLIIIHEWCLFELSVTAVGNVQGTRILHFPKKQYTTIDNFFYALFIYGFISLIISIIIGT